MEDFTFTGGSSVKIGAGIGNQLELSIRNTGNQDVGSFSVGYYVSSDANITTDDTLLTGGREFVDGIAADSTVSVALYSGARIPEGTSPGAAYLGVVIDEGDDVSETVETNNSASQPVRIAPSGDSTRTTSFSFDINRPHSVPFRLFNVVTPGTIEATITWEGRTDSLTAILTGRRRPSLADPTKPYAEVSGSSPLTLTYNVTAADVSRGVGWRLAVEDTTGTNDARGTIELTVPFDSARYQQFERRKIDLRSGDILPSNSLQSQFFNDLAATSRDGLHGIISLTSSCNCQEKRVLEQHGFVRQSFMGNRNSFGFIEKGADPSDPDVAPLIRAITPIEPEDKINPHILLGDYAQFRVEPEDAPPENYVLNSDGTLDLSVLFADDVSPGRARSILSAEASSFEARSDHLFYSSVDPSLIRRLAGHDEVEWVGAGPAPRLILNDGGRNALNVNSVQNATVTPASSGSPATISYGGLTGNGITAGVHDNGVDASHRDLNVVSDQPGARPHGTHVAGTLAGSGVRSDKNNSAGNPNGGSAFQWRGMAPQTAVIDGGDPTNASSYLSQIQNNSLDVTNHSHILGVDGTYSADNRQVDQIIRGGTSSGGTTVPRRPIVFAAANNGDNGPQYGHVIGHFSLLNQLKNSIVVGSWAFGPDRLSVFSSLGPTYDGRLKPDVIAPGSRVKSAGVNLNEQQRIQFTGGTPSTGTYTLTFSGQTTSPINFNASTNTIQNALTNLPNIGANDVSVGRGPLPNTPVDVTFQNGLANSDQPQLGAAGNGLDNGAAVQVTTRRNGYQTDGYRTMGGTSMAAPAVSGVVSLMLEAWQTTYAGPLNTSIDENPPLPSTVRAILIQTANDIVRPMEDTNGNGSLDPGEDLDGDGNLDQGVRPNLSSTDIDLDSNQGNGNDGSGFVAAPAGPDFATGWGMVDAQAAVDLIQNARRQDGAPVPNRIVQDAATQGETDEYEFEVENAGTIQVTLAWDDVESAVQNPVTSQQLVNDLDLVLEAPDGSIFYPWQLGHSIVDNNGNAIDPDNQTPGTNINVQVPINPTTSVPPGGGSPHQHGQHPIVDYVPQNVQTGNGAWVASKGRDHLNNVEQVQVDVPSGQTGHWTARVTGFDVPSGSQDYSLVGMPYPDLPDLVVSSEDKAAIPGFGQSFDVTWTYRNRGAADATSDFEYRIWLSDDFTVDGGDVKLVDSNTDASLSSLGPLSQGATGTQTSTIQISQANADNLLGTSGVSFDEFTDSDPFLLVEVDTEADVLEHEETNVAALQTARAVDVVMVMDRSGSMDGQIPVSAGGTPTKLSVLKDRAEMFLQLLRKDAGDRLGEVQFNQGADVIFGTGSDEVRDFQSGNVGSARSAVNGLGASGQTDIREALQTGLDMIPTGNDRRRVVIFFSDGKKTAGGDPTETSFLQQFSNDDVEVFSVGFGTKGAEGYAGLDIGLLETLANTGDEGFYHVTQEPTGLDKFFVNAVAGAMDSEVIVDPVKQIGPGSTEEVDVDVSSQASAVSFVLTWDNPNKGLDLSIVGPGGTQITSNNVSGFGDRASREAGSTYRIMTVRPPISAGAETEHAGTWTMAVENQGSDPVEFSASAIAESTVRAKASQPPKPDPDGFNPGDAVPISMGLSQLGGTPVANASVTVTPEVPVVGVGNLLSSSPVTASDLGNVPTSRNGESLSQRERMVIALRKKLGTNPIPRQEKKPFELTSSGGGGYSARFTDTGTPGPYSFTARGEALAEDCGPINRETIQTAYIKPDVDPGKSRVTVTSPGDGTHTVTVTPVGKNGNFLGPGYADEFVIKAPSLEPVSDVRDQLNGSYTQTFRGVDRGVVTIRVTVRGVTLPPKRIDTGAPGVGVVNPGGGSNDDSNQITIRGSGASVTAVTGVSLVSGDTVVNLRRTEANAEQNTVTAVVPAGLEPGQYRLRFQTRDGEGQSGLSSRHNYRVTGEEYPDDVQALDRTYIALLRAETQDGATDAAREMLARLRGADTGRTVRSEDLTRAATEVARILATQDGPPVAEAVPALQEVLNRSKIDGRYLPAQSVATPTGQEVGLDLGNGVQVSFGQVVEPGSTRATVQPGPPAFRPEDRGTPHVAYDLNTTAVTEREAPINVSIGYREGDFRNESRLRIFQLEDDRWVDRTVELNADQNRIRAQVDKLSAFVIATGEPETEDRN
ncbi:S8 family serine peptidase [Salinibacter ruber]|uniref:S8 family serine peptidase n=1 Tax=Salinibacter ruber TaxID=146919 RepID=UPI0013C31DDC|nr:S8 family serine peptidase [Salinibacter ruber]